ncbi:MAG: transporter [Planctomycetota bacterium]
MNIRRSCKPHVGLLLLLFWCTPASAQEAPLSEAATQPAKGRVTWREQLRFTRMELDDRGIDQFVLNTRLTLGLSGRLSAVLDVPLIDRQDGPDGAFDEHGVGDISIGLRYRFWQHDDGAIDTRRIAVFGRLRAPTGEGGLSSGGFDPSVGLVFTQVRGRHGINASASYQLSTDGRSTPILPGFGASDLLAFEASYLYRLSPASYTSETVGSLYLTAESFVDYETNGDTEWTLAPGLLWESRRWAAELSVLLPAATSIDDRAETDWGLVAGVRVLF